MYPSVIPATKGATCSAPRCRPGVSPRAHLSPHAMTDASSQDEWDPGRRKDAARPRTDRRRLGWRELRRNYRGCVATLSIAVVLFVALDVFLLTRYQRYQKETRELRASMSDVER